MQARFYGSALYICSVWPHECKIPRLQVRFTWTFALGNTQTIGKLLLQKHFDHVGHSDPLGMMLTVCDKRSLR